MISHRQSDRIGDPVSAGIWDTLKKRVFRWLITLHSRPTEVTVADQPTKPLTVKSDDIVEDNLESARTYLMPDIYTDWHIATEPDFKNLNQSLLDVDKSAGFSPYETAILRNKFGPKPR